MCIVSFVNCPICKEKINGLEMIRMQGDGHNAWTVSKEYHCPHCQAKFRCTKVTITPTVWDEKAKIYKCSCAIPEFGEITKGDIKMIQEESKTRSRIEEISLALEDVGEISYKVLAQMKKKKEDYFGQGPEKDPGARGVPTPNNGLLDKMSTSLIFIKGNLVEISEIINLF